jgi:hypothetical protein
MKNITVSLDEETYRNARVKAAAMDSSVSALVKRNLQELGAGETEFQRLQRQEQALKARIPAEFRASDTVPRDQLHERDA